MVARVLATLISISVSIAAQLPAPTSVRAVPLSAPLHVDPADSAYGLPPGFADEVLFAGLNQATGVTFVPGGGPTYFWLKSGKVLVAQGTQILPGTLLDFSDEVDNHGDFGLMSLVLDPDFANNGRLYVFYDVDHYALFHLGEPGYDPNKDEFGPDTMARIVRYTADAATGFTTIVPGSRLVLVGTGPGDGPLVSGKTHGGDSLLFGSDGTLLATTGEASATPGAGNAVSDGLIKTKEDVGPWRAQLVDCLSGKVLRVDPATGDGVPSNPFWDGAAPRAPRSRVWAVGLRQPIRFARRPGTGSASPGDGQPGTLIVGDVGAETIEELDVLDAPGLDLGWPAREGMSIGPVNPANAPQNKDAINAAFGQPGCPVQFLTFNQLFVEDSALPPFWSDPCHPGQPLVTNAPLFVHHRPLLDWNHDADVARVPAFDGAGAAATITLGQPGCPVLGVPFAGNCSIAGAFCGGADWPDGWRGAYYHADYGVGWIRRLDFDPQTHLLGVQLFAQPVGKVMWVGAHPDDGALWYIDYGITGEANVHRVGWFGGNLPPLAHATATPGYGPLPLSVVFDSSTSGDPEGGALSARWDFSDGTPFSLLPAPVRSLPSEDITSQGTPLAQVLDLVPPGSMGFSKHDIEVIRDGDRPTAGTIDNQRQYDTIHVNAQGKNDKGPLDWVGYTFAQPRTFTGLVFEEGMNYPGGGWFSSLTLQVHTPTGWQAVTGFSSAPNYPGSITLNFETFEFRFTPITGDGIRLYGAAGGISPLKFVTIGELRVLARPISPAPTLVTGTLTVTDPSGASATDAARAAVGDLGPPQVLNTKPLSGGTYSALHATVVHVHAKAGDPDGAGELACTWQVILHHDNHTHPEPITPGFDQTLTILPEGPCGTGDVYWTELRCVVTDPLGLTATRSVWLVPECDRNLNGVDDAEELALGQAQDADGDGIIDATQTDCDGDGVPDFAAIHFGFVPDVDGDGVPDGCNGALTPAKAPIAPQGPPK